MKHERDKVKPLELLLFIAILAMFLFAILACNQESNGQYKELNNEIHTKK